MTRVFFTILISSFSLLLFAQQPKATGMSMNQVEVLASVPLQVKSAFTKNYPGIEAAWEVENAQYEASYLINNKKNTVIYEESGDLFATEIEIDEQEMPNKVTSYLSRHYKDVLIPHGKKITKVNGEISFQVKVNESILVFSGNGKFMNSDKE